MSPQFVDFDADGKLDIVAGTFDGSPHLARADGTSWKQPEWILDRDGARIALNAFWNFDTKKWDDTKRCDPPGHSLKKGHMTSAIAFDVDGDGDLDLLLGDHTTGHIYVRPNDGSRAQPAFAPKNAVLHADGKPIDVPGTVATMRLCDWDRDGHMDLLASSMGDAYSGERPGGGVFLFRNVGSGKSAEFGAPVTLIPVSDKGAIDNPTRPDSGLYMDAGDVDSDGDLDLVVGGYSHWTPKGPVLDQAQQARTVAIRAEMAKLDAELKALNEQAQKASEGLPEAEAGKAYTDFYKGQKAARDSNRTQREPLRKELEQMVPSAQRRSFTWLYVNETPAAK